MAYVHPTIYYNEECPIDLFWHGEKPRQTSNKLKEIRAAKCNHKKQTTLASVVAIAVDKEATTTPTATATAASQKKKKRNNSQALYYIENISKIYMCACLCVNCVSIHGKSKS